MLAYAPMSNGRAKRMVGTLKRAIKKMDLKESSSWYLVLPDALYGYRRRRLESGYSPFELLYGIPPRMEVDDVAHLVTASEIQHREIELASALSKRANKVSIRRAIILKECLLLSISSRLETRCSSGGEKQCSGTRSTRHSSQHFMAPGR